VDFQILRKLQFNPNSSLPGLLIGAPKPYYAWMAGTPG